MTEWWIAIGAFAAGVLWGRVIGVAMYRRLLVLLAKAGSAEKLPDGKFYYIVPEENTAPQPTPALVQAARMALEALEFAKDCGGIVVFDPIGLDEAVTALQNALPKE